MNRFSLVSYIGAAFSLLAFGLTGPVSAHSLHPAGASVSVAKSSMTIKPGRAWNELSTKPGKNAESWTLDGDQLNVVTFFGGIANGQPLFREVSKKREPLPKFTSKTLIVEVPELLERSYRSAKDLAAFEITQLEPVRFLGSDGVRFAYRFTDKDELTRQGEAHAVIVGGKLYIISFDAPRLHYFQRNLSDYQALVASARLR